MARLSAALGRVRIAGPKTNLAFLSAVVAAPEFHAGGVDTGFIDRALPKLRGDPLSPALAALGDRGIRGARGGADWEPRRRTMDARRRLRARRHMRRRSMVPVEIDGVPLVADIAWSKDGPTVVAIGGDEPEYAADLEIVWGEREALVLLGGRQLRVAFPDPLARELAEDAGGGEIAAPISGRVVEVAVAAGARVEKGRSALQR